MTENAQLTEDLARWETFDGDRWHVVSETQTAANGGRVLVAECGNRAKDHDLTDEAPAGELPDDLTGTTICYDCLHARTPEVTSI